MATMCNRNKLTPEERQGRVERAEKLRAEGFTYREIRSVTGWSLAHISDLLTRTIEEARESQSARTARRKRRARQNLPPLKPGKETKWTPERMETAIVRFYEQNGRRPTMKELRKYETLPSDTAIRFNSDTSAGKFISEVLEDGPPVVGRKKYWTEDRIREAVLRFHKEHGRRPRIGDLRVDTSLPTDDAVRKNSGKTAMEFVNEIIDSQEQTNE